MPLMESEPPAEAAPAPAPSKMRSVSAGVCAAMSICVVFVLGAGPPLLGLGGHHGRRHAHGGAEGGESTVAGGWQPRRPTLTLARADALELAWGQTPPPGYYLAEYEVEIAPLEGGRGGGALASYTGAAGARAFAALPPETAMCARVRVVLEPGGAPSRWSECAAVATLAPTPPDAPPTPWPLGTSTTAVLVRWAPPAETHGLAVDRYELRWALLQDGLVDRCRWSGATCTPGGCDDLDAEGNWSVAERSFQGVFADCRGANELGCCGMECWCYDYKCCEKVPGVVSSQPETAELGGAARNATLAGAGLAAGHPFALQLRAHNKQGWSDWCPPAVLHVDAAAAAAQPVPPRPPALQPAQVRDTSILVRWEPPPDSGAMLIGFELWYSLADVGASPPRGTALPAGIVAAAAAASSASDAVPVVGASAEAGLLYVAPRAERALLPALLPLREYTVRVRARSSGGASGWAEQRATTRTPPRPAAPGAVRAVQALADALVVGWTDAGAAHARARTDVSAPAAGGGGGGGGSGAGGAHGARAPAPPATIAPRAVEITGHEVEAVEVSAAGGAEGDGGGGARATCAAPRGATTCAVPSLQPETWYRLRVRARSADGWSDWSDPPAVARTAEAGGCLALADHTVVLERRRQVHTTLDRCSKDCWGANECTARCVARLGLSAPCGACFGEVNACTKRFCLSHCAVDPDSEACRACSRERCVADYAACLGVPPELVP